MKTETDIVILGKYGIFAFVKAEHIWIFDIQSWNMKPIGIGIQHYQSLVHDLTEHFIAFNISSILRLQNASADLLANVASKLIP